MKLLLDTHIWLWSLLDPGKLKPRVKEALLDTDNELWLSPISLWEVITLCERGRLELAGDADRWIADALRDAPVTQAPLTHRVARRSFQVRLPHRDPADRLIVATAQTLELTLVTADARLVESGVVSVLASR